MTNCDTLAILKGSERKSQQQHGGGWSPAYSIFPFIPSLMSYISINIQYVKNVHLNHDSRLNQNIKETTIWPSLMKVKYVATL